MKRATVELRLCRLEEEMRQLRANRPFRLIEVATREESVRMLELLTETKRHRKAKISPEENPELFTLFETLNERLIARLGKE